MKKTWRQRLFDFLFLDRDRVQEAWDKRGKTMTRIYFEYSDGEIRELSGQAADDWWHDLHFRNCGKHVDWTRHKFIIKKPTQEKKQ